MSDTTDLAVQVRQVFVTRLQQMLSAIAHPDGIEDIDQVDRVLAAIALAVGAVVIVWPQGRKAPIIVMQGANLARQVWARRAWWLPATID